MSVLTLSLSKRDDALVLGAASIDKLGIRKFGTRKLRMGRCDYRMNPCCRAKSAAARCARLVSSLRA